MDGGAWRATVHGVAESQTRLSEQHTECKAIKLAAKPFDVNVPAAASDRLWEWKCEGLRTQEGIIPWGPPAFWYEKVRTKARDMQLTQAPSPRDITQSSDRAAWPCHELPGG